MSIAEKYKISVIVRCFNEEKHIGRLLTGIQQQNTDDLEIILVDSGSTDATLSIAAHYPVRIISISPHEFSFGYSLNKGCEAASGDIFVIASAHVYPVYEDWISSLVAPFSDDSVAITYGKQRGNGATRYSEKQVFEKWFPDKSSGEQEHPFCNNANAAIRKNIWEKYKYNVELTGLEDLDIAKRVLDDGYKVVYAAEAEIIHVHEEAAKQIYNRYRREAIALKQIYPENHMTLFSMLSLIITNMLSDYYHAWRDRVMLRNILDIAVFRAMQFFGTFRGLNQAGPVTSQLRNKFYYPLGINRIREDAPVSRKPINYTDTHKWLKRDRQSASSDK